MLSEMSKPLRSRDNKGCVPHTQHHPIKHVNVMDQERWNEINLSPSQPQLPHTPSFNFTLLISLLVLSSLCIPPPPHTTTPTL